jgi:hypothetical protein
VVRTYPLIGTTTFNPNDPSHPHTCLSRKIYALFVLDGEFGRTDEIASSDDDGENRVAGPSRRSLRLQTASSGSTSRRSPQPTIPEPSTSSTSAAAAVTPSQITATLQRNSSIASIDAPPSIWTSDWVPTEGRHVGLFSVETLLEDVCNAATSGVQWDDLEIRDTDVAGIAAKLKMLLYNAAEIGDYTNILSPERSLVM